MTLILLLAWLGLLAPRVWWAFTWRPLVAGLVCQQGPAWERWGSRAASLIFQLIFLGHVAGFFPVAAPPAWSPAYSGLLWVLLGIGLVARALYDLGPNYAPDVQFIARGWRVSDGAYRYFRHPVYIGIAFWLLGAILLSQSAVLAVAGALYYAWILFARIPVENAFWRAMETSYVGRF